MGLIENKWDKLFFFASALDLVLNQGKAPLFVCWTKKFREMCFAVI